MNRKEIEDKVAKIRQKLGAKYDVSVSPTGKIQLTKKAGTNSRGLMWGGVIKNCVDSNGTEK